MTRQPESVEVTGPFRLDASFDAHALRKTLVRAGYTTAGLKTVLHGIKSNDPLEFALLDRRTASSDPFHTLVRLFYLGLDASEAAVRRALDSQPIEQIVNIGLLRREGELLRSTARIETHADLFICADFATRVGDTTLASDHVLGVALSAVSLAALTPQSSVESALDLGTGGGIQALLAARHAEQVIGTDICRRALNFAAMNARLNELPNIELREGSFFEPVAGERFERIVANLPFVISPSSRFVCRDGGAGGDAVSEHVARTAGAHLEEGGYAVLLLNWHHSTDDDWSERPLSWTRGNGCDLRWIRFADEDPLSYAASWLRQEEKRDPIASGKLLDEWVKYYESAGIARLALGAVIMRKRAAPENWVRCEEIPIDISMTASGDQMERIFEGQTLLHELSHTRQLLEQRLKFHPAHRLEQHLAVRDGAWSLQSNKLHITSGMDFCAQIDMPTMRFLAALDGNHTVREAAAPIAQTLGQSMDDVIPACLDVTKQMLRLGLLGPA